MRAALTFISGLLLVASPAHAQDFGPLTREQATLATLVQALEGPWVLVTNALDNDLQRSEVGAAALRCVRAPAASPQLASVLNGVGATELPARTDLRGDVVYYAHSGGLRRLSFTEPSLADASRWAKKRNARNEPIYGIEYRKRIFAYYFSDFGQAPEGSGFMVRDKALYLKCPPLPEQN